MEIIRIAGQDAANLDRIGAARKDRDAIEALLAVPDNAIACLAGDPAAVLSGFSIAVQRCASTYDYS